MGTATNSPPPWPWEQGTSPEANWLAVPDFSRRLLLPRAARLEVTVTREWRFPRGTGLLFDEACADYGWFDPLSGDGV